MGKLTEKDYIDYWTMTHIKTEDDLAAVCFPDKPLYFNRFFDNIQKYAIQKYLRKEQIQLYNKHLLDIGCGRGRWLSFFYANYGALSTGIDLSDEAVSICHKKGFSVIQGSITDMPFENDQFDFISSITVLLHLPYEIKKDAISEIYRVLKPGGKVFLIESTWQDPSPHVFSLSIEEWVSLFEKYKMKLIHKSGHYFNLFRINLPKFVPFRDAVAITLDYPLDYILMNYFYGKQTNIGLQHFMVFEKMES